MLRNYLLDPKFQLKYTGYVVLVTVVMTTGVGAWLGYEAYTYSAGMSEMLLMQEGAGMEVDDTLQELLEEQSAEEDEAVRNKIITGIVVLVLILSFTLGLTGIIITHRIVGPAYKMTLLLGDVAGGQLNVHGGLRKGDELQNVGVAFKKMVVALRDRQEEELASVKEIIEAAQGADVDSEILDQLGTLRDHMQAHLDA